MNSEFPLQNFFRPESSLRYRLLLAAVLLFGLVGSASAKIRMTAPTPAAPNEFRHGVTRAAIQAFEQRLRPYLESRIKGARFVGALPAAEKPQEDDFLSLAKVWNSLDPSFLALYQAAVSTTPQGYDSCLSPGGHYVIYYTTNPDSADAVDATDTMGFGTDSTNWSTRTSGPNGIPDYIDQVAYSCDSAWSMEVKRFGFHHPVSMASNGGASSRYHFFCVETGDGYYGQTFPDAPFPGSSMGFYAHCEVRGNWTDPIWANPDSTLNYNFHPENAAHVTCVHENFHGIQFSMLWNNAEFDDFPLAWIEGTAVLMEHLGFNYIKDWLQYVPPFFAGPTMSFFDGENNVYTNSLLTVFLYEKAPPSPEIDFPRSMFFNNYAVETGFDPDLRETSGDSTFSTTWVGLLNRFFTGSYFTGIRADTSRFDLDAALMPWWATTPDSGAKSWSMTKTVGHYGMQIFDYKPTTLPFDTLTITFACTDSAASVPNPRWAASCIVLGTGLPDSVLTAAFDTAGNATCVITGFSTRNEVVVVVTNGDTVSTGYATVSFQAGAPVTPPAPVLSQPVNGSALAGTSVRLVWNASPGATTYGVQVATSSGFGNPLVNRSGITALSSVATGLPPTATCYWRVNATDAVGTGAWSGTWSFTTGTTLAIYPNPPHLSGAGSLPPNNFIRFAGAGIQSVRIYALDGNLVTNSATSQGGTFARQPAWLQWQLKNSAGKSVVPGCYRAVVEQQDTVAGTSSTSVHKLLVFP